MAQARLSSVARCMNSLKENTYLKVTAIITSSIALTTGLHLLNIFCTQKMEHQNIDWAEYQTFDKIFNLSSAILIQTGFLCLLPLLAKKEIKENHSVAQFAAKAFGFATLTTGIVSANKILTHQITDWNYAVGSIAIESFTDSIYVITGSSMLRSMNIFIPPMTQSHAAFLSAGIVLSIMKSLLDFTIDQLIKQNFINWDNLTSSEKALAWDGIQTILFGCAAGLLGKLTQKYVEIDNKFICNAITYSIAGFFMKYSYNSSKEHIPLAVTRGLMDGASYGISLMMGVTLFNTQKEKNAQINQTIASAHTPLLEPDPENQRPNTPRSS